MWDRIARWILHVRILLLTILLISTALMGYQASKIQMSYEFSRAIPTDDPRFEAYQAFRQKFGEDGNLLVIGFQCQKVFDGTLFNDYIRLIDQVKKMAGVDRILSIPGAINLIKLDSETMKAAPLFPDELLSQAQIDSGSKSFLQLPFYNGLLYNPLTKTYLSAVVISKHVMASAIRTATVGGIVQAGNEFGKRHCLAMHYSGLPIIRTHLATKIATELKWFLLGYVLLSAVILLLFFRSFSTMLLSLTVIITGVVWSLGTMHLFGYRITLLNALIPPLVMVIGIPNCIYFFNKYHTAFKETGNKKMALLEMIRRMGVVTLFCNITAAIGFAVFALTQSPILKEFGIVAGINIMMLFLISVIMIPTILSFLSDPAPEHTGYLNSKWLIAILDRLETWALHRRALIFGLTAIVLLFSIMGMFRLRAEGFIVDDLPKKDTIYTDLKFFERNFKGVMPLEIVIDTRKKNGLRSNFLKTMYKIDSLSAYMSENPAIARPLSLIELSKFLKQAYYQGDSVDYRLPDNFDISFLYPYLKHLDAGRSSGNKNNYLSALSHSFIDSNFQQLRISANMADVGSKRLPEILHGIELRSAQLFDSSKYRVQLTGSSVIFQAGSDFIIKGLKMSIMWAFLLIAICMLYLFRSWRILLCSLIPNVIPLVITAGIMGWAGVSLRPSTVIVFSIALGIAVDITIRFLVNYKQDLSDKKEGGLQTVLATIHSTGISIVYTSLVLIAGFSVFCFSDFGGEQALGWLTSITLFTATLTNLIFLPALLIVLSKR